jgi:hypothetical protein
MESSSRGARLFVHLTVMALSGAAIAAQAPVSPGMGRVATVTLAQGWSALRDGRPAEALRIGAPLLEDPWSSHDAMALTIAAHVEQHGAVQALDAYERWVVKHAEDAYLLRAVAASLLGDLATNDEPRLRMAALAALAGGGDAAARQALAGANGNPYADQALARLGDPEALARVQADVASGGNRAKNAGIAVLKAAGSENAGAIARALNDPAPPSRIAAAFALAELGATGQIPVLREHLADPDPAVRFMVSAALARLGDPSATVTLDELARSPVGDIKLFAAGADAEKSPDGPWVGVAEGLLRDPDPLVQVRAAELLMKKARDPGAGIAAIERALSDPNPAVRSEGAALLPEAAARGAIDLKHLRQLLRDPLPEVRIGSARALIAATGSGQK